MKRCYDCKIEKDKADFTKDKREKDKLRSRCKSCEKKYRLDNKDRNKKYQETYRTKDVKIKNSKYHKEYQIKNKEKIREYNRQYGLNRRKTDELFKLSHSIRCRIRDSFKRSGWKKNSKTESVLGCDFETFKLHLEKQFTKGMNWNNYGKWQLDHIYPTSLARDEKHLLELNHYTNFQPLWKIDNISKGNKIIEKQLFLL